MDSLNRALLAVVYCFSLPFGVSLLAAAEPPNGRLLSSSLSPNRRFGVFLPRNEDTKPFSPYFVYDLRSAKTLGSIAYEGSDGMEFAVWSADSSLLLFGKLGKWGPVGAIAFTIARANCSVETDAWTQIESRLRASVRDSRLNVKVNARRSAPGSGSDAFTFDAHFAAGTRPGTISFLAGLTSDPNLARPGNEQVEATLRGSVVSGGAIFFEDVRVYSARKISVVRKEYKRAVAQEQVAYERILREAAHSEKQRIIQEEKDWLAGLEKTLKWQTFSFGGVESASASIASLEKRLQMIHSKSAL